MMADRRYGFISGACTEAIKSTVEARHSLSDSIDSVIIHKVFGLPIFLFLMYVVFFLTFKLGAYLFTGFKYLIGAATQVHH